MKSHVALAGLFSTSAVVFCALQFSGKFWHDLPLLLLAMVISVSNFWYLWTYRPWGGFEMSKHTPGPWEVSCSVQVTGSSPGNRCIVAQPFTDGSQGPVISQEIQKANANLLEALEALLEDEEWIDGGGWVRVKNFDTADAARKAIARAKGEA